MNKLYLNKKKSKLLDVPAHTPIYFFPVVKIDNLIITPSDQIKYLGIVINNSFKLRSHIINISKKSNYQLMNIRKIRTFITIKLCTQLINSLAFSQIDYCSYLLFSLPSSHIKPLNRIIKSGITILCQPLIDHSSISMSAIKLKILTFPNRPAYRLLCIIHKTLYINFPKCLLESLSRPKITSIKLRSSIDNFVLQAHLSYSCHQLRPFIRSAPIIWNKLPLRIRSTSNKYSFKNLLKSYLLNNTSFLY